MRLLVLGATGPAGILLVREAIEAYPNSTIVIYARSPNKVPEDLKALKDIVIVEGQLDDKEAISKALEGIDVVLSALGPLARHPSGNPLAKGYSYVIAGMHEHGIKRIIVLGTASIVDVNDKPSFKFKLLVKGVSSLAHTAYTDIVAVGETIRSEGADLEWTIVRVPILTNKDTKEVIAGYVGDEETGTILARRAYAAFSVAEIEKRKWVQKAPLISNASQF